MRKMLQLMNDAGKVTVAAEEVMAYSTQKRIYPTGNFTRILLRNGMTVDVTTTVEQIDELLKDLK